MHKTIFFERAATGILLRTNSMPVKTIAKYKFMDEAFQIPKLLMTPTKLIVNLGN